MANLADSSPGCLADISPPHVDSLPENQTETGRKNREKERDAFLTSQLKSKDPAMPEAGTSPGLLFHGPINRLLCLNQLQFGFLFLANEVVPCPSHPSTDVSYPFTSRAQTRGSLRPGYWGWPTIALPSVCPNPPHLGRKQTPNLGFWGHKEGCVGSATPSARELIRRC